MTDPIQGASLAIQHAQQANELGQGPQQAQQTQAPKGPSFDQVMQQQQAEQVSATQAPSASPPVDATRAASKTDPAARLDSFVQGVLKDESKIDAMMARCASGKTLDQTQLLQLQGLIYGYTQKIDLASKLVDKATGGLKQVMNTQV